MDRHRYAEFVIAEVRKRYTTQEVVLERIAGNRVRIEFERNGYSCRFRLLLFAVGGSGRSRPLERRVEITSTYQGKNLSHLSGHLDVVLGVQREDGYLVGLDRRRLAAGGLKHNASTFVYTPSFDKLKLMDYFLFRNDNQRLFPVEYQVYMRPNFLIDYLAEEHILHTSGLRPPPATGVRDSFADDLDRNSARGSNQTLTYEEQVQLALKKMQIGQLGERIVFESERHRLLASGKRRLASKVDWVSQKKPFLGYDIISFGTTASQEYLEVKSSIGQVKAFYFTANESKQAENYGDLYRLICVSHVMRQPSIQEFRDPIKAIQDGRFEILSETSLVTIR